MPTARSSWSDHTMMADKALRKSHVTINSRKYDQSIGRSWGCELLKREGSLLVFRGEFDEDVTHRDLGLIRAGTVSYEYYWLDRWYSIFRFEDSSGALRNFYCNVNMPPVFDNNVLDYVDLDIDVLVWGDFTYQVLDVDEFEINSSKYSYSAELKTQAQKTLGQLISMIERRDFPFSLPQQLR